VALARLPDTMPINATAARTTTPRLFGVLLLLSIVAALVPTVWPAADLALAGLFTGTSPTIASAGWWWVVGINLYVPALFRIGLALCFVGWLVVTFGKRWKTWRLPLAFVVLAGIMGPGVVVNAVFKEHWQRARPYQVEDFGGAQQFTRAAIITDQCNNNCSFVSGHVACGFFFATLLLVHRRRQATWAVVGTAAGLVIGFARMSDVAHWFSDVLWAYPITLATSWLVWRGLVYAYQWRDARASSA
jgi:lipid A 4'-phosphatase